MKSGFACCPPLVNSGIAGVKKNGTCIVVSWMLPLWVVPGEKDGPKM